MNKRVFPGVFWHHTRKLNRRDLFLWISFPLKGFSTYILEAIYIGFFMAMDHSLTKLLKRLHFRLFIWKPNLSPPLGGILLSENRIIEKFCVDLLEIYCMLPFDWLLDPLSHVPRLISHLWVALHFPLVIPFPQKVSARHVFVTIQRMVEENSAVNCLQSVSSISGCFIVASIEIRMLWLLSELFYCLFQGIWSI